MRMQVYIGGQLADVDQATNPLITKRVSDIKEPQERKSDRTLTFTLPGTPRNDAIFGSYFEVNLSIQNTSVTNFNPDFNPNLRALFQLYVDSIPQLIGYCELSGVDITRSNKVVYSVVAYGVTSDLFSLVGEKLLTELDFSEYDHQWSKDNVENSWATSIQVNGSPVAFELGTGYVYPMVDYGQITNPTTWRTTNFFPALYFKTILDKIFEAAGFTYDSDFFDSERFKRLISPFTATELKVSDSDAFDRLIDVEAITIDQNCDVVDNLISSFDLSTGDKFAYQQENSDPSAQWSADTFTCVVQGEYIFQGYIDLAFKNNTGGNVLNYDNFKATIGLIKYDGVNYTVLATAISPTGINPGTTWADQNTSSSADFYYSFPAVRILAGEQVFIKAVYISADSTGAAGGRGTLFWGQDNIQVVIGIGSYLLTQMGANQVIEGDTIPMNSTIPVDIKQRDFLVGLIKCFNLYIEPDPNNNNNLIIEPRDDYYTSDVENWTKKLDEDKEFKLDPMGLLDAEMYLFQYSPDSDYLNKAHQDRYGYTYGRRRIAVNNQFVKSEKVIQPIFAATPLAAPQGYADRIISQIIFVDQNGQPAQKASKMRMLYYGGLRPCQGWFFVGTSGSSVEVSYPYAGHLDNPVSPTFDLSFGTPIEIYYGAAFASVGQLQYTDNNLYKAYSQRFIEEITNKDSKVVSGWFYLKPADIYNLSFRKLFFIKETYYRLLSVNNYDPVSNASCECVFLKAKDIPQAEAVQVDTSGGTGTVGGDVLPVWDLPRGKNGNELGNTGNTIVLGEDNGAGGGVLQLVNVGDGNLFSGNASTMINMGGDDNLLTAPNVVVINSSDEIITEDNTSIINNVRQEVRATIEISNAQMLDIGDTPILILTNPGRDRTIEVVNVRARRYSSSVGYSAEDVIVQYTNSVVCATFAQELLTDTGDNVYKAATDTQLVMNTGIELTVLSGTDPITGDGDFIFYIDYIIQNI